MRGFYRKVSYSRNYAELKSQMVNLPARVDIKVTTLLDNDSCYPTIHSSLVFAAGSWT